MSQSLKKSPIALGVWPLKKSRCLASDYSGHPSNYRRLPEIGRLTSCEGNNHPDTIAPLVKIGILMFFYNVLNVSNVLMIIIPKQSPHLLRLEF